MQFKYFVGDFISTLISCNSFKFIWEKCNTLKSPDPEELSKLWFYYKKRPFECRLVIHLLTLKLQILQYCQFTAKIEKYFHEFLMLFELLLITGNYDKCIEYCEAYTVRYSNDLRLQDIRARAYLLKTNHSILETNIEYGVKPFADRFCSSSFDSFVIFEREVYICCVNFMPISIGSISSKNASELWNSPIAQSVRAAILDGSFQYCNKMVCPRLRNGDLPLRTEPSLSLYYKTIISETITSSPGCYPRSIELNEDPTCNLSCPSCRIGQIPNDKDILINFEEKIIPEILENEINSLLIACCGEPFASSHYLRILRSLDANKHRINQLVIFSNGVLFTKEKWEELANLHPFKIEVRISVDATNEETFTLIRRGGDWQALLKNLEFISTLRQEGKISKLMLNYVVQNDNFMQIPDFVKFGKRYNADEVVFAELQRYGEYALKDSLYEEKAVHLQGHRNHEKFISHLQDPVMKDRVVSFHGRSI